MPLFFGFFHFTGGMAGLATIKRDDSASAIVFACLPGPGMGGPLVLVIAGVQLSTPHHFIAIGTAITTSSTVIAATIFTAIYVAELSTRLNRYCTFPVM